ncbi:MAG TPA: hypothetical protein DE276_06425 [Oceanospirillaceae bacterium]|nr:hypothetical protein [Oceanospirillaceae bacterium]
MPKAMQIRPSETPLQKQCLAGLRTYIQPQRPACTGNILHALAPPCTHSEPDKPKTQGTIAIELWSKQINLI